MATPNTLYVMLLRLNDVVNIRVKSFLLILLSSASIIGWDSIAQAGTLKEIQQRRKVIIAVKDNLPPFGFRDRGGNLQGLEIDIARKLASEILKNSDAVELVPVVNQDRLKVVIDGRVDIAIARVTITPNRSRVIEFSQAYYSDGTGIVTRQANIIKSSDLAGKKIAVLNNSTTIGTLQYMLPRAKLVGVDSYQQAQDLLAQGKVVAIAADRSLLIGWLRTNPNYHLYPDRLSTELLGIVIPKGMQYDPLHEAIDRSIQKWKADGWLQQRIAYWGLK
jgi:polar amino acid transport system substrate-binding protein